MTIHAHGRRKLTVSSPINPQKSLWRVACLVALSFQLTHGDAIPAERFKPFQLTTLEGSPRTLQDFRNKATLVSFFFPGCTYCNLEFPEVQKIYNKYRDKGFSAVWINVLPEQNKKIPDWQAERRFTVPVLIGASQASLQRDYRLKVTPTHYLLDGEGNVAFHAAGYEKGDEKQLEAQIRILLGLAPEE